MPTRLPSLRPRELIRALERAGFVQARQTGSHVILSRAGHPAAISVPNHSKEMRRPLVLGIIADAGLSVDDVLRFLRE